MSFHLMAKPTGSRCNIDCQYCFYLEKGQLYQDDNHNMSEHTLESYIKDYCEAHQQTDTIYFAWQGGEPTLRGLEFYRSAARLQQKYANGRAISNSFQTNGIIINDDWCQFFKQHNFLVGLSIDGPPEIHNKYRISNSGKGTFDQVMKAVELLKKHRVAFNSLTTVHQGNVASGVQIYEFLKSIGSTHHQYIPIVEIDDPLANLNGAEIIHYTGQQTPLEKSWTVDAIAYGDFMISIFNSWVRSDVGQVYVQAFDNILGQWLGYPSSVCLFRETCGDAMVLEHNGDVYACDHFVYPEYRLGNLHSTPVGKLANSAAARTFGENKKNTLTSVCNTCVYLALCHGGCPKHRFVPLPGEKYRHNHLCAGYKKLFKYVTPYMNFMANELQQQRPAANIIKIIHYDK